MKSYFSLLNDIDLIVTHIGPSNLKEELSRHNLLNSSKPSSPKSLTSTQSVKNLSQISKNDDKPAAVYKKQIEILERKIRTLEKENYIIKAKYKALVGQVNSQKSSTSAGPANLNHGRS